MRRPSMRNIFFLALALAGPVLCAADAPPEGVRFFEEKIRPLLTDRCFKCHSHEAEKIKGGLVLDSREAALTGGETGEIGRAHV